MFALVLAALTIPAAPTENVDDTVKAMSRAAHDRVESKIVAFDKKTGDQVLVYIADTTGDSSLEDYTFAAAQHWGIGQKGRDNGAVLFIFMRDREARIEVGYGLESRLTDAASADIIRTVISPDLRLGKTDQGVEEGVDRMLDVLAGPADPDVGKSRAEQPNAVDPVPSTLDTVVHHVQDFLLDAAIVLGLIIFVLLFLIFGGGDGGGGGDDDGGGGGGGFSGGGGGFGGGGASGSW